jgi:hypothetical protein
MQKLKDKFADLSYSKVVSFLHDLASKKIVFAGAREADNENFNLTFYGVSSVLTVSEMSEQENLENLAEDVCMLSDAQTKNKTEELQLSAIRNLKPRFCVATILYSLYFDAEKITLNGEIIFEKT